MLFKRLQKTLGKDVSLMVAFLVAEVLLQFVFIYKVNWLGQHIIMDIRVKLQKHMLQ